MPLNIIKLFLFECFSNLFLNSHGVSFNGFFGVSQLAILGPGWKI